MTFEAEMKRLEKEELKLKEQRFIANLEDSLSNLQIKRKG